MQYPANRFVDVPGNFTDLEPQLSGNTAQAAVEWVVEQRSEMLRQANQYPSAPTSDLAGGRLLFYSPSANLAEACEQVETPFFDEFAGPAWDTWVAFVADRPLRQSNGDLWYSDYIIS